MSGILYTIKISHLKRKPMKNEPSVPTEKPRFVKTWTTVSLCQRNDVNIGNLLNTVTLKQTKII